MEPQDLTILSVRDRFEEASLIADGFRSRTFRSNRPDRDLVAAVASFVFGLGMIALHPPYLSLGWFQAKLVLVLGLAGYHGYIGKVRRRFAADDIYLTSRQCRLRNEIPALFLIAIVLLAVLKPAGA